MQEIISLPGAVFWLYLGSLFYCQLSNLIFKLYYVDNEDINQG